MFDYKYAPGKTALLLVDVLNDILADDGKPRHHDAEITCRHAAPPSLFTPESITCHTNF